MEISRNKCFSPLWENKCRYLVLKGSAGSGKSVDTAMRYAVRLASQPGRNLLCVRKVAESNKNSTYAELCKAIERCGLRELFDATVNPLHIQCKNGNEVLFGGVNDANQREKLKSITALHGNITDVWVEEATEITKEDFDIIDDRLRGILSDGLFYQMCLTFNPVSAGWWGKAYFFDREDPDVRTHQSTYRDNAFCDEAYYRRMERRKLLDPDGYRVYGLGEWGATGGNVFANYKIHPVPQDATAYDDIRYGQDFGYNHANALLMLGIKDDEVYIIKEIYVNEQTTDDVIAMASGWDKSIAMWCDSAEPDRILMWRRAGFRAIGVIKKPGGIKADIDWLKQRTIHIDPDCIGTIREIEQWRWQKDRDGNYLDEPVKFGDDAMAALRYGCCEWIYKGHVSAPKPVAPDPHYNFACERPKPKPGGEGKKVRII